MVTAFPNEDIEHLLKRFKLEVDRLGILNDWKEHEYHITKAQKRHTKKVSQRYRSKLARKHGINTSRDGR